MNISIKTTIISFLLLSVSACGGDPQKPSQIACTTITNSCDVFGSMNVNKNGKKYFDKIHLTQDPTPKDPSCNTSGLCSLSVISGKAGGTPEDSLRYLDIKTNKFLSLSDKEAFTTNTNWTIGFRDWNIFTNGGIFPGQIGVAIVTAPSTTPNTLGDAQSLFDAFDLTKAEAIPDNQFYSENIVGKNADTGKCEQYLHYMGANSAAPFPRTSSAINLINKSRSTVSVGQATSFDGEFFMYDGGNHAPVAPPDQFLVLKDCATPGWFVKLKVKTSIKNISGTNYIQYDITYKKL